MGAEEKDRTPAHGRNDDDTDRTTPEGGATRAVMELLKRNGVSKAASLVLIRFQARLKTNTRVDISPDLAARSRFTLQWVLFPHATNSLLKTQNDGRTLTGGRILSRFSCRRLLPYRPLSIRVKDNLERTPLMTSFS